MPWLKFYSVENALFSKAHSIHACDAPAQKIAKKLLRHFMPKHRYAQRHFNVRFYGSNGAMAYPSLGKIRLPHNPSFLQICHEVAHIVSYVKSGKSRHDKKLMKLIGKLVAYCEKKTYWLNVAWAPANSVLSPKGNRRIFEPEPSIRCMLDCPASKIVEEASQS